MSIRPTLTVEPQQALVDQPLVISASGFTPGDAVELQTTMADGYGVTWESKASYDVDANGSLELATQPAREAGDAAPDPMRPIWSMQPVDQPQPMVYRAPPDLADELVRFTISDQHGNSADATHTRVHLPPNVVRSEIDEAGVLGTLFVPGPHQRHPAIVVLSSSVGGANDRDAALYAAYGYTALALAYFNYKQLPPVLSHIPLEYFEKALRWLSGRDSVDPERIAITGRSRGGEVALLLGATFPQVRCVLAEVASGLIWEGYGIDETQPSPAWTHRGEALPFLPRHAYAALERQSSVGDNEWREQQFLAEAEVTAGELQECVIPVETINGAVLLISARDDQVWPSAILSQVAEQRLLRKRFPHRFEHASYRAAGHYGVAPYIPTTILNVTHPVTGETYGLGGTPGGNHQAGVDAWQRKLAFLDQEL